MTQRLRPAARLLEDFGRLAAMAPQQAHSRRIPCLVVVMQCTGATHKQGSMSIEDNLQHALESFV